MYLVTASKPSSVRLACKSRFLDVSRENLITASSNLIHIYQHESLSPSYELTCYGRVSTITPFKTYGSQLEHLFITTEDRKYFTISFSNGNIITGESGDITTSGLSVPEMGPRVLANLYYIILYLYNGIISVIPIHQASNSRKRFVDNSRIIGTPQPIRLDELKIHDIAMLDRSDAHTVFAVLYRDQHLHTHLKSYELLMKKQECELRRSSVAMSNLENGTNMIISQGQDSVLCVGESMLYTKSGTSDQSSHAIATPTLFNSQAKLSIDTWVLGDDYGILYSLEFDGTSPILKQLSLPKAENSESIISIPHVLVAWKDKLFLGSHYGDSQLLDYPSLEVLARKNNMGPIQDMLVTQAQEDSAPGTIITASGAYKDGALKIVRYGVGMTDTAELEMENIRGIWGINELSLIIVGFIDTYLVLHVSIDGELEQIDSGEEELLFACAVADKLLLVLRNEIRISTDGTILSSHTIAAASIAYMYATELYILYSGELHVYSTSGGKITKLRKKLFTEEVSCFTVASDAVFVGFWNSYKLWIGDLHFNEIHAEVLEDGLTPHSIVVQRLSSMEQTSLIIAMNDGSLLTYAYETSAHSLSGKKRLALGTTPAELHIFSTRQGPNVFAACNRPSIIHAARNKVALSNTNIPSCTYFAAFECEALQSRMIVVTETGLKIGEIDDIQKLQYRSVALGELPRRLTKAASVICLLSMRMEVELATGDESQRSFLRILDPNTFQKLDESELQENEMCQSICSMEIDGQPRVIVGTSYADGEQDECTRGRIVMFDINDDKTVRIVTEIEVPGSVYCMKAVGDRLVAGINSFVRLYDCGLGKIQEVSKFRSSTFALTMAVHNNTILVGDLMKSVTYLKVEDGRLLEIARDYVPTWMTSVAFAEGDVFLGAEAEGNLLILQHPDSPLDENKMKLERIGEAKYGEMINTLVPGVLVMPDDTTIVKPHTLFGTVDGSIGVIGTINPEYINLLLQLQTNIGEVRKTIGGLKHAEYRAYKCSGVTNSVPTRFVDGDLIEEFLDLTSDQQREVCDGLGKTVLEIESMVEDLSRLR